MEGSTSLCDLEPQPHSTNGAVRRRTLARHGRKHRTEQVLTRFGVTAGAAFVMAAFFSGSAHWNEGIWAREPAQAAFGAEQSPAAGWDASASSFGFGELGGAARRQLAASPPPAPPAPCVDEKAVGNSSYPPATSGLPDGAAILVQFIIMFFMFLGLAIVCDQFFEPALSAICQALNLKDDVAGATFMAAGGSAPEFATSTLGVFVSKSDVGFGTIVGSAVFNVLFVIACCAFVAPDLKLTWWPLARDCAYYCFSMTILVFVVIDKEVWWYEAVILFVLYLGYLVVMYYNEKLEEWTTNRVRLADLPGNKLQEGLKKLFENTIFGFVLYAIIFANAAMIVAEIVYDNDREKDLPCYCGDRVGADDLSYSSYWWINFAFNIIFIVEMLSKFYAYGFFGYWKIPLNCFDGSVRASHHTAPWALHGCSPPPTGSGPPRVLPTSPAPRPSPCSFITPLTGAHACARPPRAQLVILIVVEFILTAMANQETMGVGTLRTLRVLRFVRFIRMMRLMRVGHAFVDSNQIVPASEGATTTKAAADGAEMGKVKPEAEAEAPAAEEEEEDDDEPFNPFEIPESGFGKFMWVVGFPLSFAMYLTIPDCRREVFAKYYMATFAMCIAWIGFLSYFMVWMVTEFGIIVQVRDSIMGITLLAAGTSIPDCLSSVAVAKKGHGDMAVSSSIGSNIFDILFGLPVPWFIYTAILRPIAGPDVGEEYVPIISSALAVMILTLFVMVALVITTIHVSGWKLTVKLGAIMMGLYFGFLTLALLLEFDIVLGPCDGPLA